jgi:hypothetical protein
MTDASDNRSPSKADPLSSSTRNKLGAARLSQLYLSRGWRDRNDLIFLCRLSFCRGAGDQIPLILGFCALARKLALHDKINRCDYRLGVLPEAALGRASALRARFPLPPNLTFFH